MCKEMEVSVQICITCSGKPCRLDSVDVDVDVDVNVRVHVDVDGSGRLIHGWRSHIRHRKNSSSDTTYVINSENTYMYLRYLTYQVPTLQYYSIRLRQPDAAPYCTVVVRGGGCVVFAPSRNRIYIYFNYRYVRTSSTPQTDLPHPLILPMEHCQDT